MKKVTKKLTISILSMSLLTVMAGAAMAPALGVIRQHFDSYNSLTIQFIVSLPALFIILTNLTFPLLCRRIKSLTLAIGGLLLYIVAGVGAYWIDNMALLLIFRALLGINVGIIMPLSTGLLTYYFPPERQSQLMGLAAATNQLGGIVATLVAGILANISWNSSFLVYLLGLFALVLVAKYLPNDSLTDKSTKVNDASARQLFRTYHPYIGAMCLIMILFFIFPTNFAITAQSNPRLSTNSITLLMVGLDVFALLIGLCFSSIMQLCKTWIKYLTPLCFLLGYAAFSLGSEIICLLLGCLFVGIANGIGVPYINTIASIKGGRHASTTIMPLISAALYAGQFLSPIIVNPCSQLLKGITSPYQVGVLLALIFLAHTYITSHSQSIEHS